MGGNFGAAVHKEIVVSLAVSPASLHHALLPRTPTQTPTGGEQVLSVGVEADGRALPPLQAPVGCAVNEMGGGGWGGFEMQQRMSKHRCVCDCTALTSSMDELLRIPCICRSTPYFASRLGDCRGTWGIEGGWVGEGASG